MGDKDSQRLSAGTGWQKIRHILPRVVRLSLVSLIPDVLIEVPGFLPQSLPTCTWTAVLHYRGADLV